MSKYTTGEIAKLCGVSVRTVQYYDSRGILVPSELSEGGRRLFTEQDVKKLKIICFLRETGMPISSIAQLLCEESGSKVVSIIIEQQRLALNSELSELERKLEMLELLKSELKKTANFSVESIGDIAHIMENRKKLRRIHMIMLLSGIPLSIIQWAAIILGAVSGIWWPLAVYAVIAVPYAVLISRYYFKKVSYICPECHKVFKPTMRQAFWAPHTPTARKLTCIKCGYKGYCVETAE